MRDEAREYFKSLNLKYEDITMNDLYKLISILNKNMFDDDILVMMNEPIFRGKNKNIFLKNDNTISSAFLEVKGNYFAKREAISFNQNGFIGFCGWADDKRAKVFTDGFKEWCDYVKNKN